MKLLVNNIPNYLDECPFHNKRYGICKLLSTPSYSPEEIYESGKNHRTMSGEPHACRIVESDENGINECAACMTITKYLRETLTPKKEYEKNISIASRQ